MNRIVCWFSCGAASAVATKLAIAKYDLLYEVIIARCIVKEEHPDNDRFAAVVQWMDSLGSEWCTTHL